MQCAFPTHSSPHLTTPSHFCPHFPSYANAWYQGSYDMQNPWASWLPESPHGGEQFGAGNQLHQTSERSAYFANALIAWGCLVQEIGLLFLMWDFLSQLRVVHEGKEEAGRNSLKPSVLQWWIMFHKWGKCSLFHTGKNLSSDQHILTLVIFSVVSRDNSFVLISSSFPAFLLPHTALLSSQCVFVP